MNDIPAPAGEAPARLRDLPTWMISRVHQRAHGLLVEGFAREGFRGFHFRLLAALDEFGPASQVELGQRAVMDRSDVATTLNDLADRKMIRRSVDASDRRRNIVTITSAGTKQLASLDRVVAGVQEQLLSPLSAADRTRFLRLLARLHGGDS